MRALWQRFKDWRHKRLLRRIGKIEEDKFRLVDAILEYESLHKTDGWSEGDARMLMKPKYNYLASSLVTNLKLLYSPYDEDFILMKAYEIIIDAVKLAENKLGYKLDVDLEDLK